MSKNNLSKKQKIAVTASAAIAAASSIVAPLAMTATGCATIDNIADNSQTDKEYGVSKETYNDLKQQFRVAYKQKLEKQFYKGAELEKRMNALEEDLSAFDSLEQSKTHGYTVLTNALIDFAREQKQKYPTSSSTSNGVTRNNVETEAYGIQLTRHTRTKWSDLNDLYAGMADSFKTYMHSNKMPTSTINKILAESKVKFDALVKELKATYGNDALAGLLKAKEQLITFFDDVNEDIGFLSAVLRLKDFMSEFNFTYTNYNADGSFYFDNRLDTLMKDSNFQVGNILTNELMNKIFTITRKTTGKEVRFDAKTIVPGYTLQPKLTGISQNAVSNNYSIEIDFGLIKNVYAQNFANDPEKLASLTGHIYNINLNELNNLTSISMDGTLADALQCAEIQSTTFMVHLTPEEEAKRLEEVYFDSKSDHGNIEFKWTTNKDDQAYEAFFDDARQNKDGTWTGQMKFTSLANAGLMISSSGKNGFKTLKSILSSTSSQAQTSDSDAWINKDNLAEFFIGYCALVSNVKIDENSSKGKLVTHNFSALYNNSIYNKNNSYTLKKYFYENECINFSVSKQFFDKVNDKFNQAAQFVSCYDNSLIHLNKQSNELTKEDKAYIDGLLKEARLKLAIEIIKLTAFTISLGYTLYCILSPWSKFTSPRPKTYYIINAIITTGLVFCASLAFALFMNNYYIPIQNYAKNLEISRELIQKSKHMTTLKTDLKENFVLMDRETKKVDQAEYEQKRQKFNKKPMIEMLNMYRKYSTINSYDVNDTTLNTIAQNDKKDFDQILTNNYISPDQYDKIIASWESGKGENWWINFGLGIGTGALLILQGVISCTYDYKRKGGAKDAADEEARRSNNKTFQEAKQDADEVEKIQTDVFNMLEDSNTDKNLVVDYWKNISKLMEAERGAALGLPCVWLGSLAVMELREILYDVYLELQKWYSKTDQITFAEDTYMDQTEFVNSMMGLPKETSDRKFLKILNSKKKSGSIDTFFTVVLNNLGRIVSL